MSGATWNEELLTRYLLGDLSEVESDRLDELSVTNDEFSQQLLAVENDLIDAYVQGELSDQMRVQFQRQMLVTVRQRDRVDFALSLAHFIASNKISRKEGVAVIPLWKSLLSSFQINLFVPATALTLLVTSLLLSAILLFERSRMQKHLQEERETHIREQQELESQLARQSEDRSEIKLPAKLSSASTPQAVILNFKPLKSGSNERKQLILAPSDEVVQIHLEFESDEYASYVVELRSLGSGTPIWQNGKLKARTKGGSKLIELTLPASLFKETGYQIALRGMVINGEYEDLSTYSFNVRK